LRSFQTFQPWARSKRLERLEQLELLELLELLKQRERLPTASDGDKDAPLRGMISKRVPGG
jgi:hypothetical protein